MWRKLLYSERVNLELERDHWKRQAEELAARLRKHERCEELIDVPDPDEDKIRSMITRIRSRIKANKEEIDQLGRGFSWFIKHFVNITERGLSIRMKCPFKVLVYDDTVIIETEDNAYAVSIFGNVFEIDDLRGGDDSEP